MIIDRIKNRTAIKHTKKKLDSTFVFCSTF